MDGSTTAETLRVGGREYRIAPLASAGTHSGESRQRLSRLPYSLRILLENLLRRQGEPGVTAEGIAALLEWEPKAVPSREIAFMPARVLLQDFTGVPAVVDLAAMRDAMQKLGGNAARINPLQPVELVIDHSVQVDEYGSDAAFLLNAERELERNRERYAFLRWGQEAFHNFRVVPPDTGIVHQVNLEYLARVVMSEEKDGATWAFPDTLVGTDSHTTMINGLGVLGWGVGGIEAEAAMLGQPISMLVPQVVGFRLQGKLREGSTATDLVLRVTELLRQKGVVGKFVEFFGQGLANLPLADRATIANMAPEYGATCGIFPVDQVSLDYLRFTGRSEEQVALVEAYMKAQGLFHARGTEEAEYSDVLELDLVDRRAVARRPAPAAGPRGAVAGAGRLLPRARGAARARRQGAASSADGRPLGRRRRQRHRHRRRRARRRSRRERRVPRRALPPEPRLGGDRRHHLLHQHLEPVGDGGGGPRRQEGGRARPADAAVGEDVAGAGVEGGDALPRRGGAHAVSRPARLPSRRLRLHDLHRQQRAAARADPRRHRGGAAGRGVGAVG